jgi:hypothetical protein
MEQRRREASRLYGDMILKRNALRRHDVEPRSFAAPLPCVPNKNKKAGLNKSARLSCLIDN